MYKIVQEEQYDYYINNRFRDNHHLIELEQAKPFKGELGKYLFFNQDREELIKEVTKIATVFQLSMFRVSREARSNGMYSYVGSIFDFQNRYSRTILEHCRQNNIQSYYRLWKSQNISDAGIYSNKYLKSINK